MRLDTENTYTERMLRVLTYIQQHLDDALSLDELAGVAHFSPYHFHRVFLGMVGETVMAHIRRLRLERAVMRLKHSDKAVTTIAFEAGYETHEAFTRAFRAMFDESPSGFRELHRPIAMPPTPSGVHYHPDGAVAEFSPLQGDQTMDAQIKTFNQQQVAFVRHIGPYQECGPAWQRLCTWAGQRGLMGPNMKMIGLCHDDPVVTPPDKIRYDACIVVDESVQPEGDIGVQAIPAGDYAVTMHHGPYEKLSETYAALCGQWLPQQGRELRLSACFEVYLNNPQTTKPEDLLTEVHVPLEPK